MTEVKTEPQKPVIQSDFLSNLGNPSTLEIAAGVDEIRIHRYIELELHTSPGDRYDVVVGRVENDTESDTVFLSTTAKGSWKYGRVHLPQKVAEKYPNSYWIKIDTEEGIQGGKWRGYHRRP